MLFFSKVPWTGIKQWNFVNRRTGVPTNLSRFLCLIHRECWWLGEVRCLPLAVFLQASAPKCISSSRERALAVFWRFFWKCSFGQLDWMLWQCIVCLSFLKLSIVIFCKGVPVMPEIKRIKWTLSCGKLMMNSNTFNYFSSEEEKANYSSVHYTIITRNKFKAHCFTAGYQLFTVITAFCHMLSVSNFIPCFVSDCPAKCTNPHL